MLLMIGFAVLSTSSLAVASYAWFTQSQKATASFTSITVADVFSDYNLYTFSGNTAAHGYPTTTPGASGTFSTDFALVSQGTTLSATALYPGRSLTYCLELTPIANSVATTFTFQVQNYSATPTKAAKIEEAVSNISLAYAIEVRAKTFACSSASERNSAVSSFFSDQGGDQFTHGVNQVTDIVSGSFNSTKTSYVFFTISFIPGFFRICGGFC